jgi:ectoine hydroxylase-related dioxygenase (phytanoyl-CoA dioxygenase family)
MRDPVTNRDWSMTMADQATVAAAPREITEQEAAEYRANGWAKLESFISGELAAEMLAAARDLVEPQLGAEQEASFNKGLRLEKLGGRVQNLDYWQDYHYAGRDDKLEPFHSLIYSREIGLAAQRLIGRDVGVRYSSDILAVKMPTGEPGGAPTDSHQDICSLPFDRIGPLTIWVALADLTPEHGTMRFLTGSQRAGNLGRTRAMGKGTLEYYPELLDQYDTSPPMALKAGDATVHNAQVIHWAPQNTTDEPRWGYIMAYFPDDALYTGAPNHNFDGIGLQLNKPFEHERFHRVL